jgi:carbon monoxide dehydrogenase subunit G
MKVAGSYRFDGSRESIWPLIYDPASLVSLIPGCDQIEQVSSDEYRGQLHLRLPGVAGIYTTYVKLIECHKPHDCRFEGEVNGSAGSIAGVASFKLEAVDAQTVIEYEGQAMISGPLAKLDSRFVEGIIQTLVKQGLTNLNKRVRLKQATTNATANQ